MASTFNNSEATHALIYSNPLAKLNQIISIVVGNRRLPGHNLSSIKQIIITQKTWNISAPVFHFMAPLLIKVFHSKFFYYFNVQLVQFELKFKAGSHGDGTILTGKIEIEFSNATITAN